jgi:hypothetical protein
MIFSGLQTTASSWKWVTVYASKHLKKHNDVHMKIICQEGRVTYPRLTHRRYLAGILSRYVG